MSDEDEVDQGIIYVGYAMVMHALQVFELNLWALQALKIKPGASEAQAFAKVEKWNGTTLGAMWRGMRTQPGWPDGLVETIDGLLEERNYLAHHFLRDYFIVEPSEANKEEATERLMDLEERVQAADAVLEQHLHDLGAPKFEDLPAEVQAEVDAVRPKT